MSETSVVFGRISSNGKDEAKHNIEIVSLLPSENDGPVRRKLKFLPKQKINSS